MLDRRMVPNARRDNFEVNHHYSNLLVQLGPVAANISQHCRSASVSRNAAQIVQNIIDEVSTKLKQKRIRSGRAIPIEIVSTARALQSQRYC